MENRIDRRADESLYQPKIHSERIRVLYGLKQVTGKPMTVLLDEAIHDLADRYGTAIHLEEPAFENMDQETWEEFREYRRFLDQLDYLRCVEELGNFRK
jgi:hypothetical protein